MCISSFLPPRPLTKEEVPGAASNCDLYVQLLKLIAPPPSESEVPHNDTSKELPNDPGNLPINAPSLESIVAASKAVKLPSAWFVAVALVPVLLLTAKEFLASESVSRTTCSALEYFKKKNHNY